MFSDALAPGVLLAAPNLADTFFEQAVILLLEANDDGAMGFMINRPLEITLGALAQTMALSVCEDYQHDRVYVGGPVTPQRGWVFARRNDQTPDGLEVQYEYDDGLMILSDLRSLRTILQTPGQEFRLVLGYSGWGADQLQSELREGSWIPHAWDSEGLFSASPNALWQEMLDAQGLNAQMFWGRPIQD